MRNSPLEFVIIQQKSGEKGTGDPVPFSPDSTDVELFIWKQLRSLFIPVTDNACLR